MALTIRFLSLVFLLSGISALIFQVVWQRALTLYYGAGPISITLIVSIYMAGLGFGALLGGYLAEKYNRRIEMYAVIELLIGCFGWVSLGFLDQIGRHTAGSPYAVAAINITVFLLVPTVLMGITLPLLTKIFNAYIANFSHTVSFLYFINTLGAAIGSLLASYVLISVWGLDTAIQIACIINFILAVIVIALARMPSGPVHSPSVQAGTREDMGRWVYVFVFITGFLAIGYEIVWFRVIGILVKGTAYVFPTTLAVYLAGIAFGSFFMGRWLSAHPHYNQRTMFFAVQFFIGLMVAGIFIKYYYLTKFTGFGVLTEYSFRIHDHPMPMFLSPDYVKSVSWGMRLYLFMDIFWWSLFFVFLPTCLMGSSFPLIAQLALKEKDKEGHTIARVYFFNVMGNVLGGVVTGFLLLHYLGTERTLVIFILVGLSFGLCIGRLGRWPLPLWGRAAVVVVLMVSVVIAFPRPGELYRLIHSLYYKEFTHAYLQEGMDAVVLTHHTDKETANFISGTTQGGRPAFSFYAQTIEAMSHVPDLKKALVLGYGTGGVVEAILKSDTLETVRVIELCPTLINNLKKIPFFKDMIDHPKVDVVINGARRYLMGSDERYDLIVSFLVRTTTAYSNNIYSQEFFELVKDHLNPGGVFLIWVHEPTIISATLAAAFPYVSLYRAVGNVSAIASNHELKRDPLKTVMLVNKFSAAERQPIMQSYPQFMANRPMIVEATKGLPVNKDFKPFTEYYLGDLIRSGQLFRLP